MALTKLTSDLNIIQALDDEPNDVGGLSAAQLKAKFDEAANAIKTYINNTLTSELDNSGIDSITRSADLSTIKYIRLGPDNTLQISADNAAWTTIASSGHIVYDNDGNALTQRSRLKFTNSVVSDDGTYTVVNGIKGDKGDTGATGAKGDKGDKGDTAPAPAVPGAQIVAYVDTGSSVSATDGTHTVSGTSVNGSCTLAIPNYGTWTVTATLSGHTTSATITVDTVKIYSVTLTYSDIYGVLWDGTSATAFSRTDDAAGFTNPVPYISDATNYSSPFDNIQPWAGMVRTTDATAGELVAIPKYWFKWTKSGNSMKLQIADKATAGFSVSPAHADRGDGSGERDIVYVGRYHCNSAYKSVTGAAPKANITRASARSSIHDLGSTIWQYDFAMYWTIMMLYLVEFADWNSQAKIGYGCGNQSAAQNVGASDSMPYHTGTMRSSRTTYGVGCQYRYIEGLWDNVYDWCDGIYFSGANVYCIKNPANFSDTANGTNIGTRPTTSNYISAWSIPSASGFEYALYPSDAAGSYSIYICDCCDYGSSGVALHCGGCYVQDQDYGLFHLVGSDTASDSLPSLGCRLQKLP